MRTTAVRLPSYRTWDCPSELTNWSGDLACLPISWLQELTLTLTPHLPGWVWAGGNRLYHLQWYIVFQTRLDWDSLSFHSNINAPKTMTGWLYYKIWGTSKLSSVVWSAVHITAPLGLMQPYTTISTKHKCMSCTKEKNRQLCAMTYK